MSIDEDKLLEIHRQLKKWGYADYSVEIRESQDKKIVTIKAGQNYRFELTKAID